MAVGQYSHFRRKLCGERIMLMLPFNVVLVGRVRGVVDPSQVSTTMDRHRSLHPMLAVRTQIEDDGTALYTTEGLPDIKVYTESRQSGENHLPSLRSSVAFL